MITTHPPRALSALLGQAIDYAGLFPPAALTMARAVQNYSEYRVGPEAWALGRFVVGADRLPELADELDRLAPEARRGWRVSTAIGKASDLTALAIEQFNRRNSEFNTLVDVVEAKVDDPAGFERWAATLPGPLTVFGEVQPEGLDEALGMLARIGAAAKIRMGGVTAEGFPSPDGVADFLIRVTKANLPFKATAGLHHPLRGRFRLTYAPDSDTAVMYGYLNLFVAALVAQDGSSRDAIRAALEETSPAAFGATDHELSWGQYRFSRERIQQFRSRFSGFGSCSFREPLDELPKALEG